MSGVCNECGNLDCCCKEVELDRIRRARLEETLVDFPTEHMEEIMAHAQKLFWAYERIGPKGSTGVLQDTHDYWVIVATIRVLQNHNLLPQTDE